MILSCENDLNVFKKEKENNLNTDIQFSKMSKKEAMKKAFLVFADEDAVLLRENSFPIEGKQKIGKSFTVFSDTGFILTWKPAQVFISESVNLGYIYGTYTLVVKNDISETEGTYLSIWKK